MFVHLAAAAAAFAAGAYFQISIFEYCLVVLAIAIVAVAELVNTAIEATVDLASPQLDPLAKAAKDLSAAAVLVAAVSAAGLGVLVFLPHALGLLTR